MNSRQIQYAILLSQTLNFSQVAEQLKISQPALSKQILTLEQELGVKLFDRSTVPLSVTPAGECFIREAKELLLQEDQLKRLMEGFKSGDRGRLVIGISPFRSLYMIPHAVKALKEKFPGLQVVLKELGSAQLHKGTAEGQFDFAIVNLPADETVLDIIPLGQETIVLAVPDEMAELLPVKPAPKGEPLTTVDLADCKKLPFVLLTKQQELRQLFDKLAAKAELFPDTATEVVGITTAWAMVRAGVGATILPLQFIEDNHFGEGISFFTLRDSRPTRQPAIIVRKKQYVSKYAEYAIKLLTE